MIDSSRRVLFIYAANEDKSSPVRLLRYVDWITSGRQKRNEKRASSYIELKT